MLFKKKRQKFSHQVDVSWKGRRVFNTANGHRDQKIFPLRQISIGRDPTRILGKLRHSARFPCVLKSVRMGAEVGNTS